MIEILFDNSRKEASAFGLTQWDKGQKLKILWDEMPEKMQVHFASRNSDEAIVTSAEIKEGFAEVEIPDVLLQKSDDIFLWLYAVEGSSVGETVKKGVLYVRPRPKPHTAVDDLEKSQQEILEDILNGIEENLKYIKENGNDLEYVPDYVSDQAQSLAKKVVSVSNENTVSFIAVSDAHLKEGDYNSEKALKHMSQAVKIITESCPIDFIAYLGDMTSGGSDKAITDAVSEIMSVNTAISSAKSDVPTFRFTGAEDCLNKALFRNGDIIDANELYSLIGKWNKDAECPYEDKARGYFYKDFENDKLRVICLNTSEIYGKTLVPTSSAAFMSENQLNWLCQSLDLSAKSDNAEWKIILLGHHPLDMIDRFPIALEILEAYVQSKSINVASSGGESVAYDFTGRNSAKIIGQFHGYLHNYRVKHITSENIPLIAIPNAGYYDNNYYADSSYTNAENNAYADAQTFDKTANSGEDTAFCVVVADKNTGKISALHYGAGIDREIVKNADDSGSSGDGENTGGGNENQGGNNTDGAPYTNLVPYSTDRLGELYGEAGYKNNYKLTSTDEEVYKNGYVLTGFIPVSYGGVIRVAGGVFDGSAGNYLIAYNSSKEVIWLASLNGSKDDKSGIAYTVTKILMLSTEDVETGNLNDIAFIRVSTVGVGEDLIITVNEDIDNSEIDEGMGTPVVNYTNIVQFATDKYGNTFSQNGSRNNYRLLVNGTGEVCSGYTAIGFLEADTGAVIRVKGLAFDGQVGSCLCLYDGNFKIIKGILLDGEDDAENGIVYENGIMKFTVADANDDLSKLGYFRVSGIGSNTNLIITYCEEIK